MKTKETQYKGYTIRMNFNKGKYQAYPNTEGIRDNWELDDSTYTFTYCGNGIFADSLEEIKLVIDTALSQPKPTWGISRVNY